MSVEVRGWGTHVEVDAERVGAPPAVQVAPEEEQVLNGVDFRGAAHVAWGAVSVMRSGKPRRSHCRPTRMLDRYGGEGEGARRGTYLV